MPISSVTKLQETIDSVHYNVHEGIYYTISRQSALASGADAYILIKTGSIEPHVLFNVLTTGNMRAFFYKNPVVTADGLSLQPINNKLSSTNTAETTMFYGPTITTEGTILTSNICPSGTPSGPLSRPNTEIILKSNTSYLLNILNDEIDLRYVSMQFGFYEKPV